MPRSSWKGFLRLSLVSVPVEAYTATSSGGGRISLNQLHSECGSRIRYQKTCPIHGEVPNEEIVKGYEYSKGKYAIIDTDELDKLRTESDKSVNIDTFVEHEQLDPLYFSGQTYYLTPDGPAGQKPYALLHRAMSDQHVLAVGQVVLYGKEQLVAVRPVEKLLAMSTLMYDQEVKKPSAFEDELTDSQYSAQELKLTKTLLEATTADDFDLSRYTDLYTQRLTELIEAKVAGEEIVAAPEEERPTVINLMDALKASVSQARQSGKRKAASNGRKPVKRKMAASSGKKKTAASKKKKTG